MKKIFQGTLFLSTLLLGTQLHASEPNAVPEKNWSIGIGSYAFILANDNNSNDDEFSGFNIAAAYAVNNHFQIRATYFSLESDDYYAVESEGFDLMAYGGVGFSKKGFRGYGGAGFFSDERSDQSESISGFQLGGGLGYNWGPAALDFVLTLRKADEYEDYIYESGNYIAMSGNLTISYLF
ncbi:outer membrane beta-barrel protein [Colwellia sp. 20A7]|uniref:outer membrane beta-barrel protein n=1 Tax=Colwellia sp. 20A7 TaxID=2689569 RepID=UPI00135739CE|nr:outer membrane beta-barrel protein [Colwellia sp. 20A7]